MKSPCWCRSFHAVHILYRAARFDIETNYRRNSKWQKPEYRRFRDTIRTGDLLTSQIQFDRAVSDRFHWYLKRYGVAVES